MQVTSRQEDKVRVVQVVGDLDGKTAATAESEILRYVEPNCCLVLDLAGCCYISSAGLRVLLMLGKQVKTLGGCWVFAGLSSEIMDVMEMTGFSDFFIICPDVDAAVQTLSQP